MDQKKIDDHWNHHYGLLKALEDDNGGLHIGKCTLEYLAKAYWEHGAGHQHEEDWLEFTKDIEHRIEKVNRIYWRKGDEMKQDPIIPDDETEECPYCLFCGDYMDKENLIPAPFDSGYICEKCAKWAVKSFLEQKIQRKDEPPLMPDEPTILNEVHPTIPNQCPNCGFGSPFWECPVCGHNKKTGKNLRVERQRQFQEAGKESPIMPDEKPVNADYLRFGQVLKDLRREKRMTLRILANAIDEKISYLSDIERGTAPPPDSETIRMIELALNIQDGRLNILAVEVLRAERQRQFQEARDESAEKLEKAPRRCYRCGRVMAGDEIELYGGIRAWRCWECAGAVPEDRREND